MTALPSISADLLVDGLDEEHQQLAFERLHFLNFVKTLTIKPCRCFAPVPILAPGPGANERRKIECGGCGKFIAWLPKLKNKDRRSSNSTGLAQGHYCQCCRKTGVTLIGHHVIEVDEGGNNDADNIWTVCEPCHLVIHALRRIAQAAP
jgi:hypothetical protein